MKGCLYVVGTPIGNLKDISQRALETLKKVDLIIAEDCRVTLKLLNSYEIKKPLISHHKFSDIKKIDMLVERIKLGETAALVSDAGMPCICDPGEKLVKKCHDNELEVKVVPGPCALVAALCLCGLDCSRFTFYGFLSVNTKNREEALSFLKTLKHIVVLYEAPHKLVKSLGDILKHFKDRKIIIVKEITKIHESLKITTVSKALEHYKSQNKIKGEHVLIIEGAKEEKDLSEFVLEDAVNFAKVLISNGEKKTIAAKKAASCYNLKKTQIYKQILDL